MQCHGNASTGHGPGLHFVVSGIGGDGRMQGRCPVSVNLKI